MNNLIKAVDTWRPSERIRKEFNLAADSDAVWLVGISSPRLSFMRNECQIIPYMRAGAFYPAKSSTYFCKTLFGTACV